MIKCNVKPKFAVVCDYNMSDIPAQTCTTGEMGYRFDVAHQEMSRIVHELENIYNAFCKSEEGPTGCEWLPVEPMAGLLCMNLGYEDRDELEDALKGDFVLFMKALPHLRFRDMNDSLEWKIEQDPTRENWVHKIIRFEITSRHDLWRVVHKNTRAVFRIPHMEFEVAADGVRTIDTIYNIISASVFKLGDYIRGSVPIESASDILKTVDELEMLLDVDHPFFIELDCVVGNSDIAPHDERFEVFILNDDAAKKFDEGDATDVE